VAAPAFNAELCARFGVGPIEFDGRCYALLHQRTPDIGQYMEYVRDRGTADDLPLERIVATLHGIYGLGLVPVADTADEFPQEPTGCPGRVGRPGQLVSDR
jgi:hypothetical protein